MSSAYTRRVGHTLDGILHPRYIDDHDLGRGGTVEFDAWFVSLNDREQEDVIAVVDLLEQHGPHLGFPHSSAVSGSRYSHMRELRIQHSGRPYRVLYAFDPRRTAILLLGGDKIGNDRWYDIHVPVADGLYEQYLVEIEREGLI